MGSPVKIVDLARQMIELSGLKPDEDIQIEFTGVRPGEKLFEEVTRKGENFAPTTHSKIFRFLSHPADLAQIRATLEYLRTNLHLFDANQIKMILKKAVPEYEPFLGLDTHGAESSPRPNDRQSLVVPAAEKTKQRPGLDQVSTKPSAVPLS
jgi:FlaA1/EpsC-like NDP-sugar epimerase